MSNYNSFEKSKIGDWDLHERIFFSAFLSIFSEDQTKRLVSQFQDFLEKAENIKLS